MDNKTISDLALSDLIILILYFSFDFRSRFCKVHISSILPAITLQSASVPANVTCKFQLRTYRMSLSKSSGFLLGLCSSDPHNLFGNVPGKKLSDFWDTLNDLFANPN